MIYKEKIKQLALQSNGMVTATQVTNAGIPRRCLTECVASNLLYKVSRGVYVLKDFWEDEMFVLQYQYAKGIFSHDTALYLHSMTDRTPHTYTMSFPYGYNTTGARKNGINAKLSIPENYELGITQAKSPCGNMIKVYDVERTLCDIVKGKNASDIQVVNAAMKAYAKSKDKDLPKLFEYAEQLKVKKKILAYMEVLL